MIETNDIKQKQHKILNKTLVALKPYGYKSYVSDELNITWAYVITPNKNLLGIYFGNYGGFTVFFLYAPCNNNGSGCACKEKDLAPELVELTPETLATCEQRGRAFAYSLGATFYKTPEDGLKRQFFIDQMYEL